MGVGGGGGLLYESDVRVCSSTLLVVSIADMGLSWAVQDEKLIFLSSLSLRVE